MKFFELLSENRVDEFQTKYRTKFSAEQQKRIIDNVPQKYLDWVGKNFDSINFDENFSRLVRSLNDFDRISSNLPLTDIYAYKNLAELFKALDDYIKKPKRDYKQMEGGNVVFDDGRYFVVNPQTHQASCYYGKGTKWCTAADSDYQFNQYNKDGKLFYILDRTLESSDPFYKIALLQKFDGDSSFFTATDEQTRILPAQLGLEKYNDIMKSITEYMNNEYSEQIKFHSDKKAVEKEKQRQEQLRLNRILNERREEANERRMENEWALGPDCPEEGLKAHALLKWLSGQNDVDEKTNEDILEISRIQGEIERLQNQYDNSEDVETDLLDEISDLEDELEELQNKVDVYNIIPTGEFYDMTEFIVIDAGLDDRTYAVGTEDEIVRSCKDRVDQLIDEIGYEGFNSHFAREYIDAEAVADYARDWYSDDVYSNPEVYFDDSQRELSSEQEEKINVLKFRIERTEREIERLEEMKDGDNDDDIDDKIESLQDAITEYEEEIQEIEDDPEGEFPEHLMEEKLDDLVSDVRRDPEWFMSEFGIEWEQFIDKDDFIEGVIDADGYGHTIGSYDGDSDEERIQDTWFHVLRID